IHTSWINNGSVDILDPVLTLGLPSTEWMRITHGREELPDIPSESIVASEGVLQVFVREATPPFTELRMVVNLEAGNVSQVSETLTVITCGSDLDDAVADEGAWTHEAITGFDGWHFSTEDFLSAPGSWKCGDASGGSYSNMMDAVLVTPPLCLFENSSLTFSHRMEAEATAAYPYWAQDAGVVEISTDEGKTWTIVNPTVYYPCRAASSNTIFLDPYQRCYSGSIAWKTETFDLSGWQGPVRLRFHFATNEQISHAGWFIDDIEVTTEKTTGGDTPLPTATNALRSAFPNPFNPTTVVEYEVAARSPVRLTVYDVAGRRIRDLVDEVHDPGLHRVSWDGRDNKGSTVASGVYFLNMKTGVYSASMRLVLIR
ncbi:MAG TPA: FlgD immunoglobulin-like domain containing protein, partial [Candidatus Krumholzibacterium sp.]|nr:FlgD immunoglobulin-like domain containing protein [Candidatus Krumholzibacterium sp.]